MKRALVTVVFLVGCGSAAGEVTEETSGEGRASIVGGSATSEYPAVGALTYRGSPFCTGTVIAPRTVVTAAHCLEDFGASSIRFALGPNGFSPTRSIAVVATKMHPQYDPNQLVNDVGVVTLAQDAPVTPVGVLPSMDGSWVGKPLVFVGYGVSNGSSQTGGGTKRAVTIPISKVSASTFTYQTKGKNTCNGDSGGPAFANVSGQLLLAGTTSYGDQNCTVYGVDMRADVYKGFFGVSGPPPQPKDPCAGETYEGRCDGKTLIWCEQDKVQQVACTRSCGFDSGAGYYDCR